MFLLFILGLVLLPFIEIYTIIRVAGILGGWLTFFLILVMGFAGVALAKSQGRRVFRRVQESVALGQAPAKSMVEGLLVFLGGVFLLIPGFVSDVLALFMVLPLFRPWLAGRILKHLERKAKMGTVRFFTMGRTGFQSQHTWGPENRYESTNPRDVIDVDAKDIADTPLPPPQKRPEEPSADL